MSPGTIHALLVTFDRPDDLARMLRLMSEQTRPPDSLTVVDNHPSLVSESLVRRSVAPWGPCSYVPAGTNLGPAGGIALGMEEILSSASDDDWILLLDDDDPPDGPGVLEELYRFGESLLRQDPTTAGVGLSGTRFDHRRGRNARMHDAELKGPVPTDSIGGNQLPMYRTKLVREIGPFAPELFFGFDDLEFGLRARRAGYSLYAHGDLWRVRRERFGRTGCDDHRPSLRVADPSWRRYYSLRNLIYILRSTGNRRAAIRVSLVAGFAKPVVNLPFSPSRAWATARQNLRAVADGWIGHMGRTIEPQRKG